MSNRYALAKNDNWEGLYVNGVLMTEGSHLSLRDAFAALGLSLAIVDASLGHGDTCPMNLSDVKERVRA